MRSYFAIYCMKLSFVLHNALVLKKLDEESALNRTIAETLVHHLAVGTISGMLACGGEVPVCHRYARGRIVEESPKRSNEFLKILALGGESCGPDEPVALGVVGS